MATFDFVTQADLRASLDRDAGELLACMEAKAWKAVHVLAGSLIHATLVLHLQSSGIAKEEELLSLSLSELLDLCEDKQLLSTRTLTLSSFIRPYLHLLHPDPKIRLRESPDETGARIAQALVEIIVTEVSAGKKRSVGVTSEQVVAKLQSDPSAVAILDHLLRKMNDTELERLILDSIPSAYIEAGRTRGAQPSDVTLQSLSRCYREALRLAPEETKRKAAKKYVGVLESESEHTVRVYEAFFLRGDHLEFLTGEEQTLVKTHFFASLSGNFGAALVDAAEGMGTYLESEEEARAFFVPLVLRMIDEKDESQQAAIRERIAKEYRITPERNRRMLRSWAARFKNSLVRGDRQMAIAALERLESLF